MVSSRDLDLINLSQISARLNLPPSLFSLSLCALYIDGLFHSSCDPVGVTVQNFDIVNADFVFKSISVDMPRYLRDRIATSPVFGKTYFEIFAYWVLEDLDDTEKLDVSILIENY